MREELLRFTIYLPDFPCVPASACVATLREIAGGCTEVPGQGSWVTPSGRTLKEEVTTVTVLVPADPETLQALHRAMLQYCVDAGQAEVLYTAEVVSAYRVTYQQAQEALKCTEPLNAPKRPTLTVISAAPQGSASTE